MPEKTAVNNLTAQRTKIRRMNIIRSFTSPSEESISHLYRREISRFTPSIVLRYCAGTVSSPLHTGVGSGSFSIGFVLVSELLNTAIEELGDEAARGEVNPRIRNAKDISAAAVLLSSLTALIIGIIILFIPFVGRILKLL